MYENIPHTKRLLCYLASSFSDLEPRTSYDWRTTATKLQVTVSKDAPRAMSSTSGASVQIFRGWYVKSGHARTTERLELLGKKLDYSFLYFVGLEDQFSPTVDAVVHVDTCWISAT